MGSSRGHWEQVYAARRAEAVSWYQPQPAQSLALIEAASPDHAASVIDVGGGASTLVDALLARGFSDLTVLDIAAPALAQAKARLGKDAGRVAWIAADITAWRPPRTWDIWHDRAVFHFLVERAAQDAYIAALGAATRPGATVVLSTFALDGPEKCSGLPVQRYDAERLAARLGPGFRLAGQAAERHRTPGGAEQSFVYAVLKRQ
ncbi:MAG: class I SAM-dependent methyltransferase [Proteobacteria bacterium]|nr:class I SAM-dependent methyltransferase [Pseudomonadota bacterium]